MEIINPNGKKTLKVSTEWLGRTLTLEVNRVGFRTTSSVLVTYGDTVVLGSVVVGTKPVVQDFFPLSIDYEEKFYAAGKISGSKFIKREGKPADEAVLVGRLIDRPIRPLFPKGYRQEVQVVCTVLSMDPAFRPDCVAMIAASAALLNAGVPFDGPIAGLRIGRIGGEFKAFLNKEEREASPLDLVVACKDGKVMMVEAGAKEVPEDTIIEAMHWAISAVQPALDLQKELAKQVDAKKQEYELVLPDEKVLEEVKAWTAGKFGSRIRGNVMERAQILDDIKYAMHDEFALAKGEGETDNEKVEWYDANLRDVYDQAFELAVHAEVRRGIVEEGIRPDGRKLDEVRPLSSQVGILPRTHGSSLFTGDAGSGESNIRRYLIEKDLIEAIIQLPNNIFYNTGISTYVWMLTNKKKDNRKGKVQLIDASQAFEKLRKNQGSRNCTIEPYRTDILRVYTDFVEQEANEELKVGSKIFEDDDFRYYNVTIERPLRLRCQFNSLKIDEMLYDSSDIEVSKWLYNTYKDRVFSGLDSEIPAIKEYLNDQEIKITDKKLNKLISAKAWKDRQRLMNAAKVLMKDIGTDVYMDYNLFSAKVNAAAKELKLETSAAELKTICRAMSVTDSKATPVVKKEHKVNSKDVVMLLETYGVPEEKLSDYGYHSVKKGMYVEFESDSELRDSEKIPVKEDIYDYFQREVRPYVEDAWINLPQTKIGCEISFNKYFYKPAPLRSLEENERDIIALDEQSQGFIKSLFELM